MAVQIQHFYLFIKVEIANEIVEVATKIVEIATEIVEVATEIAEVAYKNVRDTPHLVCI